jgi:hypothetical protein
MVAAAGRRAATGTVRRSQREFQDGKSKSASKDTDGQDEGGSNRLESEERHGHQGQDRRA